MILILDEYPNGSARAGACYLCGASKRDGTTVGTRSGEPDKIVDLGVYIEFEGRLCVCSECLGDIAHMLGYESRSDDWAKVNRRLGRRIQLKERENDRLKRMVRDALIVKELEREHDAVSVDDPESD